jgi:hypothetical protein
MLNTKLKMVQVINIGPRKYQDMRAYREGGDEARCMPSLANGFT